MKEIIGVRDISRKQILKETLVFLFSADWLLFLAYYRKSSTVTDYDDEVVREDLTVDDSTHAWNDRILAFLKLRFANLYPDYVVPAFIVSYLFFFGIGGFLHVSGVKTDRCVRVRTASEVTATRVHRREEEWVNA